MSNIYNEQFLEARLEQYLEEGFSLEEAERKAQEDFWNEGGDFNLEEEDES